MCHAFYKPFFNQKGFDLGLRNCCHLEVKEPVKGSMMVVGKWHGVDADLLPRYPPAAGRHVCISVGGRGPLGTNAGSGRTVCFSL